MTYRVAACTMALLLVVVLGAGCAGTPGIPPTPTPTPVPTPATTMTTVATPVTPVPTTLSPLEPRPTDFVPNGWTTIITASRNPSSYQPDIIVIYAGGTGQNVLQQLKVLVTHPDGEVQTRVVLRPPGETIPVQTTVTIPQSVNEQVRVQVLAMYSGIEYSVYDQVVPPA